MNNRQVDAVRRSGKMSPNETILGAQDAVFTVAPDSRKAGAVVQTDSAIYFCVQGALGVGRVKEVHRLAVADVVAQRAGSSGVSKGSFEMMFVADPANLSIGSMLPPEAGFPVAAKGVVASFRRQSDGLRWAAMWDRAVLQHRREVAR